MSTSTLSFLLFLTFLTIVCTANSAATAPRRAIPTNFIKDSCSCTRYPTVCISSLSSYATTIQQSPKQLAQTALSVSLDHARTATKFVSQMSRSRGMKSREYQAVKDCVDNMGDSVDRLSKSIKELGQMGRINGQDFQWHVSNVQTWVSAALTDENTCVDGFAGRAMDGRVKAAIRARVVSVAQVTSNALALVNRFASGHH